MPDSGLENKWIFPVSPGPAVLSFLLLVAAGFFMHTFVGLLLVCALVIASAPARGSRMLVTVLKRTFPFLVLIIVLNVYFLREETGGLISSRGLRSGFFHALRVVDLIFIATVFLYLLSPEDWAGGVIAFLRPFSRAAADRVALYSFIVAGFVPVFAAEIRRVRIVQALRTGGVRRGFRSALTGAPALLVPLLLSAMRRSSRLAMIVELRRLDTVMGRFAGPGGTRRVDYILPGMAAALWGASFVWL